MTFYQLHPDEQDILVEGRTDRVIIKWFLSENRVGNGNVYTLVERVEAIPDDALGLIGATRGRKNELLALAAAIEAQAPRSRTIVLVDADKECSLEVATEKPSRALSTDFSSMEVYFVDASVLEKFLGLVLELPTARFSSSQLIASIETALREMFVIRCALAQISPPHRMIKNRRKRMTWRSGVVELNSTKLLADSVAGTAEQKELARLEAIFVREQALAFSFQYVIHGHDIADVLGFWVGEELSRSEIEGKADFKKAENVKSALLGCLDADVLRTYPFFTDLLEAVAS